MSTRIVIAATVALGMATEIQVLAQEARGQGAEEIAVTGSHIPRRDFTSQWPIVTLDQDAFTSRTGVGLEATLDQLPQFNMTGAGSAAQSSASSTPFPRADAAPGAATINLRGLGLNRSLVLIDGRRAQAINGQLVVDLNTIPAAAVDRVEIITGGAAAVYGADAISGVVNVILKKDFEGVQVDVQSGITQERDGAESSASGLLGTGFGSGRGSMMLGASYMKRDGVLGKHHAWVVSGWNDPGTTGGPVPGGSMLSQLGTPASCGPVPAGFSGCTGFPLPAGGAYVIDQNGRVFNPQRPKDPAHPYTGPLGGDSGFKINPDGSLGFNDEEHSYLQVSLERYSAFGSSHLQLTDNVDVFAQLQYAETYTVAWGPTSSLFDVWSATIPYNHLSDDPRSPSFGVLQPGEAGLHPVPAEVAALLNQRTCAPSNPTCANPADQPWTYSGGLDYLGNLETDTTASVYQLIGGLKGHLTIGDHDWNWAASVSHGKTDVAVYQPEGFQSLPRLQNLFAANQYGAGFDVSQLPGSSGIGASGHCTSGLPIFNPDGSVNNTPSVSADCSDHVVLRTNNVTTLEQNIFEGTVTGRIASLESGPLLLALGADYRKEEFTFQPDSGYNANQGYPNVVQSSVLPVTVNGITDTAEVYAELAVPLWKNRLELDPGVRYSDYNTVGKVATSKLLFQLKANDWIRFRGGYQSANRAPNSVELFTPKGGTALAAGTDACGNWISNGTSLTQPWGNRADNPNRFNVQALCQYLMVRGGAPASLYVPGAPSADNYAYNVFGSSQLFPFDVAAQEGNPDLQSESARTYTAGVVLVPKLAKRLTIALDWYSIKLDHAIGIPNHDAVYQQCLDAKYNALMGSAPGTYTGAQLAGGNPSCALIEREYSAPAAVFGADRRYIARYVNQGGIETAGYDVRADWGVGNFDVTFQTSLLKRYAESPFPGAPFVDYTGTVQNSSFDYRLFSAARWGRGALALGLRWQHLPQMDPAPGSSAAALPVKSHDQFDLFGSWSFKSRWQLRGGIDNLLNADPEWTMRTTADNAIGYTDSNYDPLGRRIFLGVQLSR